MDKNEIYIKHYEYNVLFDTTTYIRKTDVALYSYIDAISFTKPSINNFDELSNEAAIKIGSFKFRNNDFEDGYITPLSADGTLSNNPKYNSVPEYRIDDYLIIAFYSNANSNPDFVFQLIPDNSTKNIELASWLSHLDIYIDTSTAIKLTTAQMQEIFPNTDTTRIKEVTDAINKYSLEFGITTPERMSHFLGQIGHETNKPNPLEGLIESCGYTEKNVKDVFGKRVHSGSNNITSNGFTFRPLYNPDLFEGFTYDYDYYFLISGGAIQYDTIYYFENQNYDSTAVKYAYSSINVKNKYVGGNESCFVYLCLLLQYGRFG